MKITIYTISDCYFSKQEKEYLASHNLPYEEKNLEENREFLTEMLTISNNFAGTPVTKIEKDDGNIVVLKGFTKDEFNQTLGIVDNAPQPEMVAQSAPQATMPTPSLSREPVAPVMAPPVPMPQSVAPAAPVMAPTPPVPPTVQAQPDMSSIAAQIEQLKKLQESLAQQASNTQVAPPVAAPAYVPPAPPIVQSAPAPAPVVQPAPQPVVPQAPVVAAPPQPAANVDDSLAAILAELQTKINSSQSSGGTTGTPPVTQ